MSAPKPLVQSETGPMTANREGQQGRADPTPPLSSMRIFPFRLELPA